MFEKEFSQAKMVCIVENIFEDGEWAIMEWKDQLGLRGCGFFQEIQRYPRPPAGRSMPYRRGRRHAGTDSTPRRSGRALRGRGICHHPTQPILSDRAKLRHTGLSGGRGAGHPA